MKPLSLIVAAALSLAAFATSSSANSIKLYTLDCGSIQVFDTSVYSEAGHLSGAAEVAVPCFLVRHPKGDFLWDTGHDENIADMPEGLKAPWGISYTHHRLTEQLAALGLTPKDIDYLAVSHWHPDHSGNVGLFPDSTFIAQEAEHAFMFSDNTKANAELYAVFKPLENAKSITFKDTHDVFGDGSVVIHHTPGHTAGSAVLAVTLPKTGSHLMSGDLHILEKGRKLGAVPVFNVDKDATRASHAAFDALATNLNARIIVQHDMAHFKTLPKFPAYLD